MNDPLKLFHFPNRLNIDQLPVHMRDFCIDFFLLVEFSLIGWKWSREKDIDNEEVEKVRVDLFTVWADCVSVKSDETNNEVNAV